MKIRTVIVDRAEGQRQLKSLISEVEDCEVVGECSTAADLVEAVERLRPDLLLVEVDLPDMTGFEGVTHISPERRPLVVFMSEHSEDGARAFDVGATDYLRRPLKAERLAAAFRRATETLELQEWLSRVEGRHGETRADPPESNGDRAGVELNDVLVVRSRGRMRVVREQAVICIEAAGDYARIHTATGSHLMHTTMTALEERLAPTSFVRVHRSTIARIDAIREIRWHPDGHGCEVLLVDGSTRPVSRLGKQRLEALFGEHI